MIFLIDIYITIMPRRTRKLKGRGFLDFLGSANNFLKKTQILSKLGGIYGATGLPGASLVGTAAGIGSRLGYGRKRRTTRRRVGMGLRLAGGRRHYAMPSRRAMHF